MRHGYTTGSCAAAAAKAAAFMLLSGHKKENIESQTPADIPYQARLYDVKRDRNWVSCAVKKDSGDDPDVTNGILIYAKVSYADEPGIRIDGGVGIGRVTKPGLDQPVGQAAINHVPRQMIGCEVQSVCDYLDYAGGLCVEISAPEGLEVSDKTFNARLGITGGISILGTSGIVEPMSNQAIIDTIRVELTQRRALGYDYVVISPGNYGLDFVKNHYQYDLDKSIKCSNYIGITMDMLAELGFKKVLLVGHIGKLIKVSGGIMNTHSREADCRMELLAVYAIQCGAALEVPQQILNCVTTEEAVKVLDQAGIRQPVMDLALDRMLYYLDKRVRGAFRIDCIMFSNESGVIATSKEIEEWYTLLAQEQAQ